MGKRYNKKRNDHPKGKKREKRSFNDNAKRPTPGMYGAVKDRDLDRIRKKCGNINLNCKKIKNRVLAPAIKYATHNGDQEILELFEDLGVILEADLRSAISSGDSVFLGWYIEKFELDATQLNKNDLKTVLKKGDLETVLLLDSYGCKFIENNDDFRISLLESGNTELVQWFVKEKGVKMDRALFDATVEMICFNALPDMIYALDQMGLDLRQNDDELFLRCAQFGRLNLVKWFVEEKNVNPHLKNGLAISLARDMAMDLHDPVGLETADYLEDKIAQQSGKPQPKRPAPKI